MVGYGVSLWKELNEGKVIGTLDSVPIVNGYRLSCFLCWVKESYTFFTGELVWVKQYIATAKVDLAIYVEKERLYREGESDINTQIHTHTGSHYNNPSVRSWKYGQK